MWQAFILNDKLFSIFPYKHIISYNVTIESCQIEVRPRILIPFYVINTITIFYIFVTFLYVIKNKMLKETIFPDYIAYGYITIVLIFLFTIGLNATTITYGRDMHASYLTQLWKFSSTLRRNNRKYAFLSSPCQLVYSGKNDIAKHKWI